MVDDCATNFGLRTLRFDAGKGFPQRQTGQVEGHLQPPGPCRGGGGRPRPAARIPPPPPARNGLQRLPLSHNPPAPELLDACDRLGILVMDEARHLDSSPQGLFELESLLRRDRSHPCIFVWSLGNEEPIQKTEAGGRIAASLKRLACRLDPTRLVTQAMNGGWGGLNSDVLDVQGFNYNIQEYDAFHEKFPLNRSWSPKAAGRLGPAAFTRSTRRKVLSAPMTTTTCPGRPLPNIPGKRPPTGPSLLAPSCGRASITGEPTPYKWPCISSHFGIMDTCGFPKDNYYYYQAWWSSHTVLHILPHWNWPGSEGKVIDVWCFSNCEEVELFLNGASLGRKKMPANSHLEWPVPYAPGALAARGFRDNQEVAYTERRTTGAPARLISSRPENGLGGWRRCGGGQRGRRRRARPGGARGVYPGAFQPRRPRKILGVGNGNPSSHEADKAQQRSAFNGWCQVIYRRRPNRAISCCWLRRTAFNMPGW